MNIIVDADACPAINLITDLAIRNNIKLTLYTDNTHNIKSNYAKVITLSKGYQSVDMVIANDIQNNDILVTQDFGLATIALSKKAFAVHPKGMIYNDSNIDQLLYERHMNAKLRKSGGHTKGPKKRVKTDDDNLINSLNILIDGELNKQEDIKL